MLWVSTAVGWRTRSRGFWHSRQSSPCPRTGASRHHQLAVEAIVKFGAARVVAGTLRQTADQVGGIGANEMVEGMARIEVARKAAAASEAMATEGALRAGGGALEIEASDEMKEASRTVAIAGVVDIAGGASAWPSCSAPPVLMRLAAARTSAWPRVACTTASASSRGRSGRRLAFSLKPGA